MSKFAKITVPITALITAGGLVWATAVAHQRLAAAEQMNLEQKAQIEQLTTTINYIHRQLEKIDTNISYIQRDIQRISK